jgi:kinesin family protein 20
MAPPTSILAGMTSIRIPNPSTRRQNFSFTKVFPPEASQSDMFTTTTLPLVKDVLRGENGLIFAYGVTNSGKTYTVQGKCGPEQSGILPRALDVVFNSIKGHQDIPSVSLYLYSFISLSLSLYHCL